MNDDSKQAPQMDWEQVALNGGPPCFHVEGPQYCGRAERWAGHGPHHTFVSLATALAAARRETWEKAVLVIHETPREDGLTGDIGAAVRQDRLNLLRVLEVAGKERE